MDPKVWDFVVCWFKEKKLSASENVLKITLLRPGEEI